MPIDISTRIPGRASDAGPEAPANSRDCYDWLDEAREEIRTAQRGGRTAERINALHRAQDAIAKAEEMAEREILGRWQGIGMNEIIPDRVAPSVEWQRELAQDMRALGWQMTSGRYMRPEPPLWRK